MPSKERVERMIATVEGGDIAGALEEFYAPDVEMRDNKAAPMVGRAENLERERDFFGSIRVNEHRAVRYVVSGDDVAIDWVLDFTTSEGARYRMEQVAFQRWEGDRIARERFYYDSATLERV
ncbi:MAG TPA: nuclear transport factor 2 family protein [Longimicrobiales bacterium]|nr:nuclear transport factor 2 family protein [Longimicrobiales bacterium]